MNRQRKVIITITYNDLGIIVDTKAEELDLSSQPNLQPTCNNLATDAISRQAAIDALEWKWAGKAALDAIKNLPAAEHGLKWILCSERLPEDIKPVIVTWKNTDPKSYYQYIVGKHFIGTGHFCNGKWFWYSSTCEDLLAEYGRSDVDEIDEAIEVIAWMPLPEPYHAERREE